MAAGEGPRRRQPRKQATNSGSQSPNDVSMAELFQFMDRAVAPVRSHFDSGSDTTAHVGQGSCLSAYAAARVHSCTYRVFCSLKTRDVASQLAFPAKAYPPQPLSLNKGAACGGRCCLPRSARSTASDQRNRSCSCRAPSCARRATDQKRPGGIHHPPTTMNMDGGALCAVCVPHCTTRIYYRHS